MDAKGIELLKEMKAELVSIRKLLERQSKTAESGKSLLSDVIDKTAFAGMLTLLKEISENTKKK